MPVVVPTVSVGGIGRAGCTLFLVGLAVGFFFGFIVAMILMGAGS